MTNPRMRLSDERWKANRIATEQAFSDYMEAKRAAKERLRKQIEAETATEYEAFLQNAKKLIDSGGLPIDVAKSMRTSNWDRVTKVLEEISG